MSQHKHGLQKTRGFTLVEVLIALGIVAVALAAGARSTGALTRNAERQSDLLLAQLCAENALVAVRLSRQMPSVGEADINCEQAGAVFNVHTRVAPTPNPSFRRVDAQVSESGTQVIRLSTILGRF